MAIFGACQKEYYFAQCKSKQHEIVIEPTVYSGFYARRPTRVPITLVKLYRSPRQHKRRRRAHVRAMLGHRLRAKGNVAHRALAVPLQDAR